MDGTSRSEPALSEVMRSIVGSMAISGFVVSEEQQRAAMERFEERLRSPSRSLIPNRCRRGSPVVESRNETCQPMS